MTDATPTPGGSTEGPPRRRARRRHAAPLTRIVVGGLSLSAACALMTGMALATKNADAQNGDPQTVTLEQSPATTVDPSAVPGTPAGPSVTIVVRHHPAPDAAPAPASPPAAAPAAAAPRAAAPAPKAAAPAPKASAPVTKSRAS